MRAAAGSRSADVRGGGARPWSQAPARRGAITRMSLMSLTTVVLLWSGGTGARPAAAAAPETPDGPESAVRRLESALRSGDPDAVLAVCSAEFYEFLLADLETRQRLDRARRRLDLVVSDKFRPRSKDEKADTGAGLPTAGVVAPERSFKELLRAELAQDAALLERIETVSRERVADGRERMLLRLHVRKPADPKPADGAAPDGPPVSPKSGPAAKSAGPKPRDTVWYAVNEAGTWKLAPREVIDRSLRAGRDLGSADFLFRMRRNREAELCDRFAVEVQAGRYAGHVEFLRAFTTARERMLAVPEVDPTKPAPKTAPPGPVE